MSTQQRIEIPGECPLCGADTCLVYAGHYPVNGPPVKNGPPTAVHCASEHNGEQTCDWRHRLNLKPQAEGYIFDTVDPDQWRPYR